MTSRDNTYNMEYFALNLVSLPKRLFSDNESPESVCERHEIASSADFSSKNLLISEKKLLNLRDGIRKSVNCFLQYKFTNNLRNTQYLMPFFRIINFDVV